MAVFIAALPSIIIPPQSPAFLRPEGYVVVLVNTTFPDMLDEFNVVESTIWAEVIPDTVKIIAMQMIENIILIVFISFLV